MDANSVENMVSFHCLPEIDLALVMRVIRRSHFHVT
jgi:hypothetical protein